LRRWKSIDTTFGFSSRTWQRDTPRAEASARAASSKSSGFWPGTNRTRTSSQDGPERTPSTLGIWSARGRTCRRILLRPNGLTASTTGRSGSRMVSPQACSHFGSRRA
jgi:hypothetical protein